MHFIVSNIYLLSYILVITKTASRNVAFKAARLGDSIFDRQSEIRMTMTEAGVTVNSPSHEEDFDDVHRLQCGFICF